VGEGALGSAVVIASAFDGDEQIEDAVFELSLTNQLHGSIKVDGLVFECTRFDEQISEVIGHHPLRSQLCRIDTNEGELFGPNLFSARSESAARLLHSLLNRSVFSTTRLGTFGRLDSNIRGHLAPPKKGKGLHNTTFPNGGPDGQNLFFSLKAIIPVRRFIAAFPASNERLIAIS